MLTPKLLGKSVLLEGLEGLRCKYKANNNVAKTNALYSRFVIASPEKHAILRTKRIPVAGFTPNAANVLCAFSKLLHTLVAIDAPFPLIFNSCFALFPHSMKTRDSRLLSEFQYEEVEDLKVIGNAALRVVKVEMIEKSMPTEFHPGMQKSVLPHI